ncbi:MAG: hypothetical protein DMD67_04630, partial [Gemmatimonadetes bacterium]
MVVQHAREPASDTEIREHRLEQGGIRRAHLPGVEPGLPCSVNRLGGEPTALRRRADSFCGHRVREPGRVTGEEHTPPRQQAGARSDRDHEPVALRGSWEEPDPAQVLLEMAMQVDRTAVRRQHAHREMGGL